MEFQAKVLKWIDCGSDFIFTSGEQLFFHDKQFKNEPKRCKACKMKRVSVLGAPPAPGKAPLPAPRRRAQSSAESVSNPEEPRPQRNEPRVWTAQSVARARLPVAS